MKILVLSIATTGPLAAAPLSHWRLDGNPNDSAGSAPLVWSSAAVYSSTVAAPGSTQAASVANGRHLRGGQSFNFDGTAPFSACAWIRAGAQDTTIIGDMVQGGAYTGWELHVGTPAGNPVPNTLNVWLISNYGSNFIQVNSPTPVLDNAWHFVAFTYDGTKTASGVTIYVDGVDHTGTVAANSLTGTIANNAAAELNLGSRQNGANHNFSGLIDEARVFSHVLTQSEITALYTSNSIVDTTPPALAVTAPAGGETVIALTEISVTFNEDVTGVSAVDLLIAGAPAAGVTALTPRQYRFAFAPPPAGSVAFTWAAGHDIADTSGNSFGGTGWSVIFDPDAPQNAVISEFLTDNAGGLEDEDHESPDWIEIYNPGPAAVQLAGWHLTDNLTNPDKWTFPAASLPVGGRLVVFASGKDRALSGAPLHTSFKLNNDGGSIALVKPGAAAAFSAFTYGPQQSNVSTGITATGTEIADWRCYTTPTPGAANSTDASIFGAALSSLVSAPELPQDFDDILITVRLDTAGRNFAAPLLRYRVQFAAEQSITMHDDGLSGDTAAGDGLWTATIPANAAVPGQMLRWYVTATRSDGLVSRWPIFRGGLPAPEYFGTVIADAAAATQLPVYRVFASGYTLPAGITPVAGSSLTTGAGYHALDTDAGARAAIFFHGCLYDNVLFRIKGTTTRNYIKRSHRVDFNPGFYFRWSDAAPPQRELSLNAEFMDPSYSRQYLSSWLHRTTGTGAAPHFPVRVQMNGSFWKLAFHTFSLDDELMESMGLDGDGALYRQVGQLTGGAPEKQTRTWEDSSDFTAFAAAISEARPLASRRTALFDHADLPAVINDIAVMKLTQEADDVWANMGLHRDSTGTGEWRPIPFDLNLSFGQLFYDGQSWNTVVHGNNDNNKSHPLYGGAAVLPKYSNNPSYNNWYNRLYDAVMRVPETRAMLLRRLRSLMDSTLGESFAESPLEAELDAHVARITQESLLDRQQWRWPPTSGTFQPYGLGNVPFAQAVSDLKNLYLAPRRTHLFTTHSIANTAKLTVNFDTAFNANTANAQIPAAQTGVPAITFGTIESNPPGGNQDQEYIELRNGTLFTVDLSGWQLTGGVTHTIRPGTVLSAGASLWLTPRAAAFRARTISPRGGEDRFVQGGYDGHLNNFGETLTLLSVAGTQVATITTPAAPSDPQFYLAVTEVMYHPEPDGEAEFIELMNISPSVTLDLAGVKFTAGIDFTFPAGSTLAPGARILVVRNTAAFESIHGAGHSVAGQFSPLTSLSNGGELLKIDDATGSTIREFTYSDAAPWPAAADGGGSLVLIAPSTNPDHSLPQNWRTSMAATGNPGSADALPFAGTAAGDDDNDGWTNLFEYCLGPHPLITHTRAAEGLTFTVSRVLNADDAAITGEVSTALTGWTAADFISATGTGITFRVPAALAAENRVFIRARASLR